MTRIQSALTRRLAGLKKDDKGFSLIELLVVVIIIGILAAIAIPIYLGVQNSAKDSAAQADLTNAKTAVIAYGTANPAATTVTLANLDTYGYKGPSTNVGTILFTGVNPQANFCLQTVRTGGTQATDGFFVTAEGNVAKGKC